jgi:PBP1b-binding outer membrane lipoprotein LpoB
MTVSERVAAGVAVALLLSGCMRQQALEIDVRDSAGNCYRVTRLHEGHQQTKMVSQSECRALEANK